MKAVLTSIYLTVQLLPTELGLSSFIYLFHIRVYIKIIFYLQKLHFTK